MNFVSRFVIKLFLAFVTNVFVLILAVIFMLLEAPTMKHKLALVLSDNEHDVVAEEHHIDRILDGVISYLGVKTVISLLTGVTTLDFVRRSGCAICDFMGNLKFPIKLHSEYRFNYCRSAYCGSSVIAEWIWCGDGRNCRYYCIKYCDR